MSQILVCTVKRYYGVCGGDCAGDCARVCASRRRVGSGHRTSSTSQAMFSLTRQRGKKALACQTQPEQSPTASQARSMALRRFSLLYYMVPNIEGVTCVFNFESLCLSNDACAFIVFNFWCLSLPFCIVWAKCVQWMRMCSYDCAKCVLASAKVFSVSVNVFRVLQHVF